MIKHILGTSSPWYKDNYLLSCILVLLPEGKTPQSSHLLEAGGGGDKGLASDRQSLYWTAGAPQ